MIILYIAFIFFVGYFQEFFAALTTETVWTIGICTFIAVLVICFLTKEKSPDAIALKAYALMAVPAEIMTSCLMFRGACRETGFDLLLAFLVELPLTWPIISYGFLLPLLIDISKYKSKASWAIMATSFVCIYFYACYI